jgi:2-polyprenyl-6-methoxyphenol hydroxylase-like FAD-dependent oxidoreductase
LAQAQTTSRAAAIHARTLEVLEGIGASGALVAAGLQVPAFVAREGQEVLLTVSFADLPTRYPYVLMLPQSETEAILARRLEVLGGTVHRACEAVDLHQDAEGVAVTVRRGGQARTLRARYLVGADGYHSLVRERAGIALQVGTYAQSFVLGDVVMDWPLGAEAAQLFLAKEGLLLVAAFPHGRHRLIATLEQAPEQPTREDLQAILDARGLGAGKARIHGVQWSSRFRIHHGVAERFHTGRVFLIGDAAHVHSPAGGQGMNIGIQEACDLGERLAAVLRGGDTSALDGYEAARRPVAERVVAQTDRLTRLITLQGPVRRELRNLALEVIGHLPGLRRKLALQFAELDD